jgi:hypothetical protein
MPGSRHIGTCDRGGDKSGILVIGCGCPGDGVRGGPRLLAWQFGIVPTLFPRHRAAVGRRVQAVGGFALLIVGTGNKETGGYFHQIGQPGFGRRRLHWNSVQQDQGPQPAGAMRQVFHLPTSGPF